MVFRGSENDFSRTSEAMIGLMQFAHLTWHAEHFFTFMHFSVIKHFHYTATLELNAFMKLFRAHVQYDYSGHFTL